MVNKEEYIQLKYRFCWCHRCGFEWIISEFVCRCPDCGSADIGLLPIVFYGIALRGAKKVNRDLDIAGMVSYSEYGF